MEDGYRSFERNFQKCCHASATRLAYRLGRTDPERMAAEEECDALFERIRGRLGEERRLINQFEEAKNHVQGWDLEYVYQQGFQDCVTLLNWLGML